VRAALDKVRDGGPLPGALRPLDQDPAAQLPTVVGSYGATGRPRRPHGPVHQRCLARVLTGLHPDVALERDLVAIRADQATG
jgi:hypothetical protein